MNAQSEIDRITQNVADTYSALEEKGATMPEEQNSDNLAATARTVPQSGGSIEGAVLYTAQTLTDAQQTQARTNINAASIDDINGLVEADARLSTEIAAERARINELVALSESNIQKIEDTDIEKMCIKFSKLLYGTDKAESFIFCTDPHVCNPPNYDAENKMITSFNILKIYYDATPTSFVVCGGDWLNDIHNGQTNEDACYKLGYAASWIRSKFDRFYTAIGNHEDNYPYGAAYEGAGRNTVESGLSMETIRNLMLPYEKELYYSFDGSQTKFYVMNSSDVENDQQMTDYRWEQVAWLAERLKQDDSDNSAVVIHAALLRPIGDGVFAHLAENILKLCQAYNNGTTVTLNGVLHDFSGCNGCVRFMLAGHVHDGDCAETHYGIPVILTRNMLASADSGNGYKPTFDLCLADYDEGVLRMVRVGDYGTDRDILLASRNLTGDIFTVTLNLTDVTASYMATNVREGDAYENTLTTQKGYTLSSVTVTMGDVDITNTAYSNGQISIADVTGDIVITAVAVIIPTAYTNLADPTSEDWSAHMHVDAEVRGGFIADSNNAYIGKVLTNYIPVTQYDILRFKGFDMENGASDTAQLGQKPAMFFYDADKNFVAEIRLDSTNRATANGLPTSAITDENGVTSYEILIRGDTNAQFVYKDCAARAKFVRFYAIRTVPEDEIIITVNEEINVQESDPTEPVYTNLVSTSLGDDGTSVYNDPYGYMNGYVLSGSGGAVSNTASANCVATGYIMSPSGTTPIYVKGSAWDITQSYCRFGYYKSIGVSPSQLQSGNDTSGFVTVEQLGDNYFKLSPSGTNTWLDGYYYRLSLFGNVDASAGEELIITHGEPIE